jgi:hypothetical protein
MTPARSGSPLFEPDRFVIKFHNLWSIEAPEGYSLLFTHPINRFDLPFTTLTGLVDCDLYHDSWIHFLAHWHDMNFSAVLPRGTPVAQCTPVKRESWVAQTAPYTAEDTQRVHDLTKAISRGRAALTDVTSGCDHSRFPAGEKIWVAPPKKLTSKNLAGSSRWIRALGLSALGVCPADAILSLDTAAFKANARARRAS